MRALYERETAHEAVLTNLLQRRGYDSLEAVRAESEARGEARALLTVLEARGVAVSEAERETILNCLDLEQLRVWLQRAVVVDTAVALFQ